MIFRILGPLEVVTGAGAPVRGGTPKRRLLLATLLVHPNEWVGVGQLMGTLWDGRPPRSAVANVHTYISDLRDLLAPVSTHGRRLHSRPGAYRLEVGPGELDVEVFDAYVKDGRRQLGQHQFAQAEEQLRAGLRLWRGPPLDGLPAAGLQPEVARLNERRYMALEDLIDAELALGRHRDVVSELQKLTARQPFREHLWAQLILALYRSGQRAAALAAYQQIRRLLDEELGIPPGRALRRMHQQILNDDPILDL